MTLYNPNVDLFNDNVHTNEILSMIMCIRTKFGRILSIHSQDTVQNQILTSIKSRNSVANLQNMTLYNPNVDLVNDNMYIKFDNSVISFSKY